MIVAHANWRLRKTRPTVIVRVESALGLTVPPISNRLGGCFRNRCGCFIAKPSYHSGIGGWAKVGAGSKR